MRSKRSRRKRSSKRGIRNRRRRSKRKRRRNDLIRDRGRILAMAQSQRLPNNWPEAVLRRRRRSMKTRRPTTVFLAMVPCLQLPSCSKIHTEFLPVALVAF